MSITTRHTSLDDKVNELLALTRRLPDGWNIEVRALAVDIAEGIDDLRTNCPRCAHISDDEVVRSYEEAAR